jgi:cobalt-zinc-cadmium efflux system outer membrane protein
MKKTNQIILIVLLGCSSFAKAQVPRLPLDSVLAKIALNPSLQAYDAKISAEDVYVTGAKSLDAPKISAGQYQTPYQVNPNAGSFMIQAEQLFTNPAKLRAKEDYLRGMSKVTAERQELPEEPIDGTGKAVLL